MTSVSLLLPPSCLSTLFSLLSSPASKSAFHLASIRSFAQLTTLLHFSGSGSKPNSPDLSDRTACRVHSTTRPLAPLRALACGGDIAMVESTQ